MFLEVVNTMISDVHICLLANMSFNKVIEDRFKNIPKTIWAIYILEHNPKIFC